MKTHLNAGVFHVGLLLLAAVPLLAAAAEFLSGLA